MVWKYTHLKLKEDSPLMKLNQVPKSGFKNLTDTVDLKNNESINLLPTMSFTSLMPSVSNRSKHESWKDFYVEFLKSSFILDDPEKVYDKGPKNNLITRKYPQMPVDSFVINDHNNTLQRSFSLNLKSSLLTRILIFVILLNNTWLIRC